MAINIFVWIERERGDEEEANAHTHTLSPHRIITEREVIMAFASMAAAAAPFIHGSRPME